MGMTEKMIWVWIFDRKVKDARLCGEVNYKYPMTELENLLCVLLIMSGCSGYS